MLVYHAGGPQSQLHQSAPGPASALRFYAISIHRAQLAVSSFYSLLLYILGNLVFS